MHHDLDIDVICTNPGEYRVRLHSAVAGEAAHVVRWPWRDLELENRLKDLQIALLRAGGKRRKALTPEEETVQRFGRELFDMLFTGEALVLYRRSAERARQARVGLRIRLHLDDPPLAALPWEFLYDAAHADYLCLSTQTPVLRYLDVGQPVAPLTVTAPLRVLGVVASPADLEPLDVSLERQRVETALAGLVKQGLVELVWLEGQTWRDLQRTLRREPWHVVHFIGHGGFDAHRDEGVLWLADDAGQARALHASELARLLTDHADLRLVLLNACESARPGALDIFSSTATALVRRGLPAVIAMQYAITDRAAIEFARSLYEALADGLPIDAAVSEARKAVQLDAPHSMEWGTPVLHLRAADGRLFELETPTPAPQKAVPSPPMVEPSSRPAEPPAPQRTAPDTPPAETPPVSTKTPAVVKHNPDSEVERALAILTDWEHYPPEERLKAGDFLGAEPGRDPRPGVGLRPDGLPDIDWVEIPETDANDHREFIYQENERRTEPTFWIARYPITYLQFQAFVDAADGYRNLAWRKGLAAFPEMREQRFEIWNRPCERVTWYHSVAFCRWLSAKAQQSPDLLPSAPDLLPSAPDLLPRATDILLPESRWHQRAGITLPTEWKFERPTLIALSQELIPRQKTLTMRPLELSLKRTARITLPTEWQWEKAARGWDGRRYPWGSAYVSDYANVDETERKDGLHYLRQTSPVGMYPQGASPFDVLDLSGNVWEWCLNEYKYPARTQESGDALRVLCGGSWFSPAESASVVARGGAIDFSFGGVRGFRIVCGAHP